MKTRTVSNGRITPLPYIRALSAELYSLESKILSHFKIRYKTEMLLIRNEPRT